MVISKRVFNESLTTRIHVCLLGNNNCNSKEISLGIKTMSFTFIPSAWCFFYLLYSTGSWQKKTKAASSTHLDSGTLLNVSCDRGKAFVRRSLAAPDCPVGADTSKHCIEIQKPGLCSAISRLLCSVLPFCFLRPHSLFIYLFLFSVPAGSRDACSLAESSAELV